MKKILSLILVTIIVLSTYSVAFASAEDTIAICGIPCDCGGTIFTSYTYGPWSSTDAERDCTHGYTYGTDGRQSRIVIVTYSCGSCSFTSSTTKTEYKWTCHGYN